MKEKGTYVYAHTPLPWRVRDSVVVENECGRMVADCAVVDSDEVNLRAGLANAQNAQFIVRAINNHKPLVDVCRYLLSCVEHNRSCVCNKCTDAIVNARDVLAKAEGREHEKD